MPLPHVLDPRLHDGDVMPQGVGALDDAVVPLDPPRQGVDLDLHDREAARVGHEHPERVSTPVTSAAMTDSVRTFSPDGNAPSLGEKCRWWSQTVMSSCVYVAKRRLPSLYEGVHEKQGSTGLLVNPDMKDNGWDVHEEMVDLFGRKTELEAAAREAEKRRDAALKSLDEACVNLLRTRKRAEALVDESMMLLNSVSFVPLKFIKGKSSIKHEQRKFRKSDEIVRRQFARDAISLGVAAVAAGGLASIVWKVRNRVSELFKSNRSLVLVGACTVVAGLFFGAWKISRVFVRKSTREWEQHAKECIEEAKTANECSLEAKSDEEIISSHMQKLELLLTSSEGARNQKFPALPREQKESVTQLLSNTEWLAKLLNGEVTT